MIIIGMLMLIYIYSYYPVDFGCTGIAEPVTITDLLYSVFLIIGIMFIIIPIISLLIGKICQEDQEK